MNKTLLACALAIVGIGAAHAAKITPVNINQPGVGLNETTPAAPVGGNPGVTVGEQRRIAYQFAADLWGAVLESPVEIKVEAQFTPLACTATAGTLGSAGTKSIFSDFGNGKPETWYGGALANAISGIDQDDTDNDIRSNFNSSLGGTNPDGTACLTGSGWYYGLDGNTPANAINFLDVVMHEIAHGLNFQGFYNVTTGAVPYSLAPTYGDVFSDFVYDDATFKSWRSMTDAQRANAAIGENLVWTGPNVTAQVPAALAQLVRLRATGPLTGSFDYGTASFGPAATASNFTGTTVVATDGTALGSQACGTLTNGAAVSGKIAVVDRGTCGFAVKAKNAQNAGAIGVIVVNNAAGAAPGMSGTDPTLTIPTISLSQNDGAAVKGASPGVNVSIAAVPGRYSGADGGGRARLYAPAVRAPGSTFSHYDVSATPNALQEPAINQDLDANLRVDLNPALFQDLGWVLNSGNGKTRNGSCDTGVPVLSTTGLPGVIIGANLQASDKLCRTSSGGNVVKYRSCMSQAVANTGVAPSTQIRICTSK